MSPLPPVPTHEELVEPLGEDEIREAIVGMKESFPVEGKSQKRPLRGKETVAAGSKIAG